MDGTVWRNKTMQRLLPLILPISKLPPGIRAIFMLVLEVVLPPPVPVVVPLSHPARVNVTIAAKTMIAAIRRLSLLLIVCFIQGSFCVKNSSCYHFSKVCFLLQGKREKAAAFGGIKKALMGLAGGFTSSRKNKGIEKPIKPVYT